MHPTLIKKEELVIPELPPCKKVPGAIEGEKMKVIYINLNDRPDIIKGLSRLERPEELLATTWALDYYVPLYYQHENWFYAYVLPYEKLLIDENELSRLFNYLRLDKPKELMNIIRKPSVTTAEMVKQISCFKIKWKSQNKKQTS